MNSLILFFYLQILDLMSTLICLKHTGGSELNPIVRAFIWALGSPELGLLVNKLVSIPIGIYYCSPDKFREMRMLNYVFSGVVLWNVLGNLMDLYGT